jgi:hypothetical protein
MTKFQRSLLFAIVAGVFIISRLIFLLPSPISEAVFADVDITINGDHYNFDIQHSFLDPIVWTLFTWFFVGIIMSARDPQSPNTIYQAQAGLLLLTLVMVVVVGFLLYILNPSHSLGFLLGAGVALRNIMHVAAYSLLAIIAIYSIGYTAKHKLRSPR